MGDFCFVIQPFDNGKFDKRYKDTFKPAIEAAGLEAYRVDEDDAVIIPIETIEEKIKAAAICIADITENNPNVWYEVGYALASNKVTILLCSDERQGNSYPFDIRQRNVTQYKTESQSDFDFLKSTLTSKLKKMKEQQPIKQINPLNDELNISGLSYQEVSFLAGVLSVQDIPDEVVTTWGIKEQMKKSGFNDIAFNICIRKLLAKNFIEISEECDYNGNEYRGVIITDIGSKWILENESKFSFEYKEEEGTMDSEIPFN
jgi:hypothetical protein